MIKFLFTLIFLFPSLGYTQLNAYDRQELPFKNALGGKNNGFESGAASWTCSPALVMDTDAADQIVPNSKSMATWDSTSAGQNCYSTAVKIPESGTCAVGIWYAIPSGTGTHLIVANDGVGDLATRAIVSSALGQYQEVEFPCTSSTTGNARIGIRSVAANEPLIQKDDGYIGRPTIITSSSATGRNYIKANPDAEIDTSGWARYADAAGSIPVDGTGGTPNITWDRTTTLPLAGDGSFLLTKDAANRQGQGVSFDFTIEREDRGKMLQIDYTYEIASGTYATGDLSWHVIDVTNGKYIQPSAYQVENVGVSSHAQPLQFQSSIDSTSYRLILHVASTSASAYTAKFDSVKVGPQNQANGPPVTDEKGYNPTIGGLGTGSTVTNSGFWKQVGDSMFVVMKVTKDANNGSGTAAVSFSLPSGYTIDASKLPATSTQSLGYALDGTGGTVGSVVYRDPTTVNLYSVTAGAGNWQGSAFTANKTISLNFKVPIVGWSSNVVVSSSANTRPVAAWRNTLSSTTITANTALQFTTAGYDSHGGFTSNSTYTVRVPGFYRVVFNGLSLSSSSTNCNLVVNGTGRSILAGFGASIRGIGVASAQVNAGDAITVSCDANVTASSAAAVNLFIEKLDGPSQIAADNLVVARYTTAAGQSTNGTGSATLIDFGTKDFDLFNSVTTGASWKFTAPVAGYYELCTLVLLSATTGWADTEAMELTIYKNGSAQQRVSYRESFGSGSQLASGNGCGTVQLNASEYIDLRVTQLNGSNINMFPNAQYNWVTVKKLGGLH